MPKPLSASFGARRYGGKAPKYASRSLLAWTLYKSCYENNPCFLAFKARTGLPFRSMHSFGKAELEERSKLYRMIAERVWDPASLLEDAR